MSVYIISCQSYKGSLLKEIDEKIQRAHKASLDFANKLHAVTYLCDEYYISGKIVGLLYDSELNSGFCRRKGLFKVSTPTFDCKYYNYFPNEETSKGKELLKSMLSLPFVKEYELNLLFNVNTRQKAINYQLTKDRENYVVAIADKAYVAKDINYDDMKDISLEDAMNLLK